MSLPQAVKHAPSGSFPLVGGCSEGFGRHVARSRNGKGLQAFAP